MLKTAQQVVDDFYQSIKNSVLGKAITGTLYNGGTSLESDESIRKPNATTEDIIVRWHGGIDSQFQTGEILLHIYVSDITKHDGTYVENMDRGDQLSQLIRDWMWEDTSEYTIKTIDTPHFIKAKGIDQHILVARLQFYRAAS